VVIPDSARWSKPSTGGRTEDEAHNFDRIVNSWYLIPEGTKFSHPVSDFSNISAISNQDINAV
jgi:hypothetical protein